MLLSPESALSFPAKAAMLRVSENSRAIELDFVWFTSSGEVRRPERLNRIFPLRGQWREVAAFEAAKAKRYVLQREAMLFAETRGKLAGARRTRQ